ncbi:MULTISPECIES: hydrogenase 4 membrane subunit [Pasteurellaceae]|uniref:NADH-ubiquinone/plastoquinone oxidoreductase chain 4L n=1 Tax=Pasteurella bettyae CCUG 2042 TaxID=1095749 RepID=I3DCK6_9PAST|nr:MULTISPECIES: hydrogenase 4 membrane subunit [Pasteurellaceae]EIJ69449.1 NADH-ubiquinone/plastoquinone oxidoreductase chain 4L [Pasteurella bettyae CCUG 2042]SUB21373.1 Hydrogenase-4 component E [Pasteurella bettyae]
MLMINILAGLLILTSLLVIMGKTARKSALFYALQSLVLVGLFVCLAGELKSHSLYMWSISAFITKVILVPAILIYATKKIDESAVPKSLNSSWLIPITAIIVVVCYLVVSPIKLPLEEHLNLVLSVSLSHFLLGILCIVSQRNILKQVFGYCLMENGSHLTLALLASNAPELVEIGIATDAFFAVIILVVLVNKIYRTLNTLDAKELTELKG